MGQISILEGVYGDATGNVRAAMPINLYPEVISNGLSGGYLRTYPGLRAHVVGPGADRGAILWGLHYLRVMGSKLVQLTDAAGSQTIWGDVGDDGLPVSLDYGFDRVCIASNGHLFYYDGLVVTQVTDPDIGVVNDVCFIDGYYMTTDGTSLVVTDLSDPYSVNPLKYGSSEADPDPIQRVMRVRDEIYAVNQFTIENFQNVGGTGFPFQRNPAGLIQKGAVARRAVCYFMDSLAFVGGGREEDLSVYLAGYGSATPISTPEIDRELNALDINTKAALQIEAVHNGVDHRLLIHLPNKTLVYHAQASKAAGKPVWTFLAAGVNMDQPYPGRHFCFDQWGRWVAGTSTGQLAYLDQTIATLLGAAPSWKFETLYLFNETRGAIVKAVELTGASGLAPSGDTLAQLKFTRDGRNWVASDLISLGAAGQTRKRMQWRPKVRIDGYMGLRFIGSTQANASFMRLDVDAEPLNG